MSRHETWQPVVLDSLRMGPDIIKAIEQLMPQRDGPYKLAAAVELLQGWEPMVVETDQLKAAREAVISANVQYANALAAASSTHGA